MVFFLSSFFSCENTLKLLYNQSSRQISSNDSESAAFQLTGIDYIYSELAEFIYYPTKAKCNKCFCCNCFFFKFKEIRVHGGYEQHAIRGCHLLGVECQCTPEATFER